MRTLIEYASSLWSVGYLEDVRLLESIQLKEVDSWSEWLGDLFRRLDLFSFQGHLLRTDLTLVCIILRNKCSIGVGQGFLLNRSRNTSGHQLKLFKSRTRSERRNSISLSWYSQCWKCKWIQIIIILWKRVIISNL